MPKAKTPAKGRKKAEKIRPWEFEEIPIGLSIEFEDRSWMGTVSIRRELITGASHSSDGVLVHFGGETLPPKKLLSSKYAVIRDNERFPCGVLPLDDYLTNLEKFKIARAFAKIICASWLFIREFEDDRLDPDTWLISAKYHKVLVGNTGRVKMIWDTRSERDPDFSVDEMCRNAAVENAFHYLLNRFALLNKYNTAVKTRAEALDDDL